MEKRFEITVEVTNSEVKEIVKLLDKGGAKQCSE